MTKSLFFLIDEVSRDAIVAANLKVELKSYGIQLEYGNRYQAGLFKHAMPFDAIILPNLIAMEALFPDPSKNLPPIIMLPGEGVGGIPDNPQRAALKFLGFKFMEGDPSWANSIAAFCLWGKQQLRGFEEFSPNLLDKCHIVGHPRFDDRCIKSNYVKHRNSNLAKTKLGLISRFSLINPFDLRNNFEIIYTNCKSRFHHLQQEGSEIDVENLWHNNILDLRTIIEITEAADLKKYEIEIRVHPRENRGSWEELINKYNLPLKLATWDQPFIHWLENIDFAIAPPSTSFYDMWRIGMPTACFGNIYPQRRSHVLPLSDDTSEILNYVPHPKSISDLYKLIEKSSLNKGIEMPVEVEKLMEKDTDFPRCKNSISRLAKVCVSTIEKNPKKPTEIIDRLYFNILKLRQNFKNRSITDQGCQFILNKRRSNWIDNLIKVNTDNIIKKV